MSEASTKDEVTLFIYSNRDGTRFWYATLKFYLHLVLSFPGVHLSFIIMNTCLCQHLYSCMNLKVQIIIIRNVSKLLLKQ